MRPLSSRVIRLLRAVAGERITARLIRERLQGAFDGAWYLHRYPDVRGKDPLVHYAAYGAPEGRDPHPLFDSAFYRQQYPSTEGQIPADNYLREGLPLRRATHPQRGFCLIPPLGRPLRILTLLVRYGTERYRGGTERVEEVLSAALPGSDRQTIIIDNRLPSGTAPEAVDPRRVVIPGDNSSWEFSGWDEGLRFTGKDALENVDFVHFATDAFEQLGPEFASALDTRALETLLCGPCITGHIDFFKNAPMLGSWQVPSWVRSSYFFIRPAEVKALGSLTTFADRRMFSGDAKQPFANSGPVDPLLREYITGWLVGAGTGQGVQWHSRFDLTAGTLVRFEGKARAILNELALSARLRELGCWMADALWLRAALSGQAEGRLFEQSWSSQVQLRL